jgi:hypothetical protein
MAFVLNVTKTAGTEGVNANTLTFVEWFTASDGLLAGDYIMVGLRKSLGLTRPRLKLLTYRMTRI